MIVNKIDSKGMWSEGPSDGSSSLKIDHVANANKSILAGNATGFVDNVHIAQKTRYEFYDHGVATQTFSTTGSQLFIDGSGDYVDGGLNTWNTASGMFFPEETGRVYTIRVDGLVEAVGGNPILHVDFDISGAFGIESWARHHQGTETLIRATAGFQHVHAVFSLFSDEEMFLTGAMIQTGISIGTINVVSSSIFIKEG